MVLTTEAFLKRTYTALAMESTSITGGVALLIVK
jgi:hypothetical protein